MRLSSLFLLLGMPYCGPFSSFGEGFEVEKILDSEASPDDILRVWKFGVMNQVKKNAKETESRLGKVRIGDLVMSEILQKILKEANEIADSLKIEAQLKYFCVKELLKEDSNWDETNFLLQKTIDALQKENSECVKRIRRVVIEVKWLKSLAFLDNNKILRILRLYSKENFDQYKGLITHSKDNLPSLEYYTHSIDCWEKILSEISTEAPLKTRKITQILHHMAIAKRDEFLNFSFEAASHWLACVSLWDELGDQTEKYLAKAYVTYLNASSSLKIDYANDLRNSIQLWEDAGEKVFAARVRDLSVKIETYSAFDEFYCAVEACKFEQAKQFLDKYKTLVENFKPEDGIDYGKQCSVMQADLKNKKLLNTALLTGLIAFTVGFFGLVGAGCAATCLGD